MSRIPLSLLVFFGLSSAGFSSISHSQAAAPSVEYVDYEALVKAEKKVEDLLASTPCVSAAGLRGHTLTASSRASAKLPKANTKPLQAQSLYNERKHGSLMVGRYYDCGNCDKLHARIMASAVALTDDGICVTNYHVLEEIIERRPGAPSDGIDSLLYVATVDGKIYAIDSILAYSKIGDAAIFKVNTRGDKLSAVPLGAPAPVGAEIHAITHPSGHYYYYTQGIVARNVATAREGPEGNRMEVTSDYAVGSSGGPILDIYGNLVGIVSTTQPIYADPQNQRAQQLVVRSTIPVGIIRNLFTPQGR